MQNNNNGQESNLVIARGITKKDGKKPGQVVTRLFFDVESTKAIIEQFTLALEAQSDGVSLTLLEGEGKNGHFGMIAASALEMRDDRPQGGQARPAPAAQKPAYQPRQGGYTPKTPGYAGRK